MKRYFKTSALIFVFVGLALTSCKKEYTLFVGGFTRDVGDKGFSIFDFDSRNGTIKLLSQFNVGPSPSYFCYSKRNNLFYMINEVMEFRGTFGGGLSTFKYDPESGQLDFRNELLLPYGGPCYISMSPDSGYLFVANYPNGSVVVVRLHNQGIPEMITDTILYMKSEPDASHAHMILNDPAGKLVYVTDLGLDRIIAYEFDKSDGKLNQADNGITTVPEGNGPRHFVFNSDGSKLYLINEHGSRMMVFDVTKDQGLILMQTLPTTSEGFREDNYCADVHISNNGKYLYGSNRGENTIVTYKINDEGTLTLTGHTSCGGDWPRNFVTDPSGKFLLVGNQKSNNISVLKINRKTGIPSEIVNNITVTSPACLKF